MAEKSNLDMVNERLRDARMVELENREQTGSDTHIRLKGWKMNLKIHLEIRRGIRHGDRRKEEFQLRH